MAKKKTPKPDQNILTSDIAIRETVTSLMGYFNMLPDPDPVLTKMNKSVEIYRQMESDAQVGADIIQRKSGVLSMLFKLNPPDDATPDETRAYEIIKSAINRLNVYRVISQLLNAPLYGSAFMEVVWEYDEAIGKLLPVNFEEKPVEWFYFDSVNQPILRTKDGHMTLPSYKFIVASNEPTYLNPYGKKELSKAFWPVTFKRGGMKFWAVFMEKFGIPRVVAKVPDNTTDTDRVKVMNQLELMIQDAIAVLNQNSEVTTEYPKGDYNTTGFDTYLKFMNAEISKAIVGQTLTTEVSGASGSYAASKTHSGILDAIVLSDKRIVEQAFNQLIKYIIEINFSGNIRQVTFEMYQPEEVSTTLAERDKTLTEAGVKFTKEYFMRAYKLKDDEIEISNPSPVVPAQSGLHSLFAEGLRVSDGGGRIEKTGGDLLLSVENLAAALPEKLLQAQIEQTLAPVIKLFNESNSFEEVLTKLAAIYPDMETQRLEDLMSKALLLSNIIGRQ